MQRLATRRAACAGHSSSAAALLIGCAGCLPQRELSSYSDGASSAVTERSEPLQPPALAEMDQPRAPIREVAPTLTSPAPALLEGGNTANAPRKAPPASSSLAQPEPSGSAAMPLAPAADAGDACAASGGFSIVATSACYLLGDDTFSWEDARSFCQAWGGDLVEIGTVEENAQLAQHIQGSAWIGASDPEEDGTFRWASGDALEYMGWANGQPNNLEGLEHCVELRAFDDRWSDVPCTDDFARQALCERALG